MNYPCHFVLTRSTWYSHFSCDTINPAPDFRKHDALSQCWFNVGPPSPQHANIKPTLAQRLVFAGTLSERHNKYYQIKVIFLYIHSIFILIWNRLQETRNKNNNDISEAWLKWNERLNDMVNNCIPQVNIINSSTPPPLGLMKMSDIFIAVKELLGL